MIINDDCLNVFGQWDTIFLDPPDNIGLKYDGFQDSFENYEAWLEQVIAHALASCRCAWLSFNVKWLVEVAHIQRRLGFVYKPCVQTFTFGQHNHNDLGNCYRPLWRISTVEPTLYPDAIRIPSWRQQNGDKRADPRGRVPGDVFAFPRVTGNSKQRRAWHKTQLHEGLVERCLALTTPPGGTVADFFAGSGTTLRVCKRRGWECTLVEKSRSYYEKLVEEHSNGENDLRAIRG